VCKGSFRLSYLSTFYFGKGGFREFSFLFASITCMCFVYYEVIYSEFSAIDCPYNMRVFRSGAANGCFL
jgi:hypothetical protein